MPSNCIFYLLILWLILWLIISSYDMMIVPVFHEVIHSRGHLILFQYHHSSRFCESFRFEPVEIQA